MAAKPGRPIWRRGDEGGGYGKAAHHPLLGAGRNDTGCRLRRGLQFINRPVWRRGKGEATVE